MKTIILLIATIFAGITCNAQISLEENYNHADDLQIVHLNYSGDKYAVINYDYESIKLYNLDHSLWKTINIGVSSDAVVVNSISENIFTTDNEICVLLTSYDVNDNPSTQIIDEENNIVLTVENYKPGSPAIVNTADGLKLILKSSDNSRNAMIYSLPGTITAAENVLPATNEFSLISYPNPAKNTVTIEYSLPEEQNTGTIFLINSTGQEIRSYQVDKTFNDLRLDTSSIASGIYFWKLKAGNFETTQKMIVVN